MLLKRVFVKLDNTITNGIKKNVLHVLQASIALHLVLAMTTSPVRKAASVIRPRTSWVLISALKLQRNAFLAPTIQLRMPRALLTASRAPQENTAIAKELTCHQEIVTLDSSAFWARKIHLPPYWMRITLTVGHDGDLALSVTTVLKELLIHTDARKARSGRKHRATCLVTAISAPKANTVRLPA